MKLFYFFFIPKIISIYSFNNLPLYRYWNCVAIEKNIDKNKPYEFKVGDIPLIAWKTYKILILVL